MRKAIQNRLFFALIIFSFSCGQVDKSGEMPNYKAAAYVKDLNTSDTFRYELTMRKGKVDSLEYSLKKKGERDLHLTSLEKGFDSIQIRMFYGCALSNNYKMITLINQKGRWAAKVTSCKYHYNEKTEELDSVSQASHQVSPQSGWHGFIGKLFELKILSLEDNNSIPGFDYPAPMDGCGVGIEIATRNTYRTYNYDNPEMYSDRYWQAENVLQILKLINTEFQILSIDSLWPPDNYRKKYVPKKPSGKRKIKIVEVFITPDTLKN